MMQSSTKFLASFFYIENVISNVYHYRFSWMIHPIYIEGRRRGLESWPANKYYLDMTGS